MIIIFFFFSFVTDWLHHDSRWGRHLNHHPGLPTTAPVDLRTGYISRSHLRSPSGRVRWLSKIQSGGGRALSSPCLALERRMCFPTDTANERETTWNFENEEKNRPFHSLHVICKSLRPSRAWWFFFLLWVWIECYEIELESIIRSSITIDKYLAVRWLYRLVNPWLVFRSTVRWQPCSNV